MRMILDMLTTVRGMLPDWAFTVLVGVLLAVLIPAWLFWLRSKQIKGVLRRWGRADDVEERTALADEAFRLTGGRGRLLVALMDEAHRLDYRPIWTRALEELERTGQCPQDVARIRAKITVERPPALHPVEEAVHVERMLGEGLLEPAWERLAPALERFPDDPDLIDLRDRIAAARSEAEGDRAGADAQQQRPDRQGP